MVSGSGACAKRVVVDARHHMLGRLASIVAKELLNGQKVVLVRCEEVCISGGHVRQKMKIQFNLVTRKVTHHEYIQVGKGRDVGLNQIALFKGKVSSGNGEQVLSRDIYVGKSANIDMAKHIVRDAKIDYPAPCNALETLLVHKDLSSNGGLNELILELQREGVELYGGPKASALLKISKASSLHHEYSSLACTIEIVEDVFAAINHINKNGRQVRALVINFFLVNS